ncbi:MAG: UDP-N-acetyl-alpha-D-glucosamine C6 dehydratase [Gammaproteobacteria bacterium]|nr:UDP-N-acetyl-alpha-D-glucosamine C6 dehydratase [Gammaproteobacteria bacterium]
MTIFNRRNAVYLHDLAMVVLAWQGAWLARSNFYAPDFVWRPTLYSFVIAMVSQALIFRYLGLYRGLWRFASLPDLWNILRSAALGTVTIGLVMFVHNRLADVPRSILLLYPVFLVGLLSGPRLAFRFWKDHTFSIRLTANSKRVLVLGVGRAADTLVRDMIRDGRYSPVGILDDESTLRNTQLHGVPVLGGLERLKEVSETTEAEILVIAMPSATNAEMQRVVALCEATDLPFRTLPRLIDQVQGDPGVNALREVSIEDLLGRDAVSFELPVVQASLTGKVVLVSGGGGSIGAELCRQIARLGPHELVIFEQSEYNLYRIEMELRQRYPDLRVHAVIGDVTDEAAVDHVLERFNPMVVFHAAAYKHVPMLQYQVRQAVRNNVLGTWRMACGASRHGVRKFVLISTDKAVNPTSLMGASKRIAEIVAESFNQLDGTRFTTVRFGNVLGSAGSVVPLFQEQIRNGGPVTVTHPEMTRFFMTIPEATQLILQAGAMGRGGEIYVLDMGEPIKIAFLAQQLIRLSGLVPGEDIRIDYTGLRPGERLHEELFHEDERLEKTQHRKIFLARHRTVDRSAVEQTIGELTEACERFDEQRITALIKRLVPEMTVADVSAPDNVIPFKRGVS